MSSLRYLFYVGGDHFAVPVPEAGVAAQVEEAARAGVPRGGQEKGRQVTTTSQIVLLLQKEVEK